MPDLLVLERDLWDRGFSVVAGVDEAGRGALFGPVVAAAVVLDRRRDLSLYRDSKTLSEPSRENLYDRLAEDGHRFATGLSTCEEIDATDILRASLLAMARALDGLGTPRPDFVLVDGPHYPGVSLTGRAVVHGDGCSASVAAASIVAKVTRDRLVREMDRQFPGYGLGRHKGYATQGHLEALRRLGPTPLHRRTFRGVEQETA
ncbi:MAG: ribonuclease HII [Acidobacteriota bacterium]